MVDETKKETPSTEVEQPVTKPALKQLVTANGETITLKETDMAITVIFDTNSGIATVHDLQNSPLRAYARMLLNEAIASYAIEGTALTTKMLILKALADGNKKGLHLPFSGK